MENKKKNKKDGEEHKGDPAFYNDQIGENAGEGRMTKEYDAKK